jgi:flagellar basal body P-ring formation protein FlgA
MNKKLAPIAWIPTLLVSTSALAESVQAPEAIRHTAETFLVSQLQTSGPQTVFASADALDPRLRLPRCSAELTGLMTTGTRLAARVTVGVSCAQPKWTVYVPVRVESELPVVVARRAMSNQSTVTASDVDLRTVRVPGLAATYISSVEQLAGHHLRQAVAPGTALTVEMLGADVLVRRGQRVTLVARAGSVEVRAQGEAMGDAGPTGRVRVLNLASRRIVEGQVESRDQVRVSL